MRPGHDTNVKGCSARIPERLGAVPGNINADTSTETKTSGVNEMVDVRNEPTAEEILADMKEEDKNLLHVRHDKDWERRTWVYAFLRAGLTEFYIQGKRYVIT
jgi:hypothetical protein